MRSWSLGLLLALGCRDKSGDSGSPGGDSGDTGGPAWDPRFDDIAAAFEAERAALGVPGLAVGIVEDGALVFAAGFGTRLPTGGDPVLPTTLFRIGSVTKMMTAAAALQQVEAGRLTLDGSIQEVYPDFEMALDDSWAPELSLHRFLSHQGAFYDYLEIDGDPSDAGLADMLLGDFPENIWCMAPPGSFWNYSNPNFSYAGLLAEEAAGKPYRSVMAEDLFAPLGMDRTFLLPDDVLADGDYAVGATTNWTTGVGSAEAAPDSYDVAWGRPAGFAFSHVADLARFAMFLVDGDPDVLSDEGVASMTAPQVDTLSFLDRVWYGYGTILLPQGFFQSETEWSPAPLWQHGGAIPGFSADLYILPEQRFAVVTLASGDGAYLDTTVDAILELAELPDPVAAPDPGIDPADYPDYVGTYSDPWNIGDFTISVEGDTVYFDAPLLDAYGYSYTRALIPSSRDSFYLEFEGSYLDMTFVRDDSGAVRWMRDRYFVGEKLDDAARGRPRPAPDFDPERLHRALDQRAWRPLVGPRLP
jgi:CubicO group peptidase (beta-lactamase class C family)